MKKFLIMFLTAVMLFGMSACTNNNGGNNDPVEPVIKGETVDVGRLSLLVPEGWSLVDLGTYRSGFNALLVKGDKTDNFLEVPTVTIQYMLPVELVISGRGFYEDTRDLDPIDFGDFHWDTWTGKFNGLVVSAAESYSDIGTMTVYLNQNKEGNEIFSMDDPEIRAIIKSLVPEPTTEADWVKIENGVAVATLPEVEGYSWNDSGSMYSHDVEAWNEIQGNQLIMHAESGTGVYSLSLMLCDEEDNYKMGIGQVDVHIKDGKVDFLYNAQTEIYKEPQEIEHYEHEDTTDYELFDGLYSGTWVDNNNKLTLFIQNAESDVEHTYQVVIQSDERVLMTNAVIEEGGTMFYYDMSINGTVVDTFGYFELDGSMLLWSHNEEIGEYENATIFTKVE